MIPISQPTFGQEEVDAVRRTLESGWVAGQGPRGRELEARFAERCEVGHAVAVSNCTAALHLALLALGVGQDDEVLVADYTYPATGHSVLYTGAIPVFVDVLPGSCTIDPEAVTAAIGPRTKGIIAVDTFGQCADYAPLVEAARDHDLFLVEDAACSVGATYRGRPSGALADVACFSLHARKGITSGEGGVLVTDDVHVAERARQLSCFGVESAFERQGSEELVVSQFELLGYNYKLSDIQAAIALVQLDRLDDLLARRRRIADVYDERLAPVPGLALPTREEDRDHTWQAYVLTLDFGIDRSRVVRRLREAGVQSNIGTFASHVQPVYGEQPSCPNSADAFVRHLAIPMHANLADDDIERVVSAVTDVISSEVVAL